MRPMQKYGAQPLDLQARAGLSRHRAGGSRGISIGTPTVGQASLPAKRGLPSTPLSGHVRFSDAIWTTVIA